MCRQFVGHLSVWRKHEWFIKLAAAGHNIYSNKSYEHPHCSNLISSAVKTVSHFSFFLLNPSCYCSESLNGPEKRFHHAKELNHGSVWSGPGLHFGSFIRSVVWGTFHTCYLDLDKTETSGGPDQKGGGCVYTSKMCVRVLLDCVTTKRLYHRIQLQGKDQKSHLVFLRLQMDSAGCVVHHGTVVQMYGSDQGHHRPWESTYWEKVSIPTNTVLEVGSWWGIMFLSLLSVSNRMCR